MKKVILFSGFIFIVILAIVYSKLKQSGFEFSKKDIHPEYPLFPKISDSLNYINKEIDTVHIAELRILKNSDKKIIFYSKTSETPADRIMVFSKNLKPIFYIQHEKDLEFDTNENNKVLFIIHRENFSDNEMSKIRDTYVVNLDNGQKYVVHDIKREAYLREKKNLKLIKYTYQYQHSDNAAFFEDSKGNFYVLKNNDLVFDDVKEFDASKIFEIKSSSLKDFHNPNIILEEKIVNNVSFKPLFTGADVSPYGNSKQEPVKYGVEEDNDADGFFDKSRLYYFKIKLKNKYTYFKTDWLYGLNSFKTLHQPKSDSDSLIYYHDSKIYVFYKK